MIMGSSFETQLLCSIDQARFQRVKVLTLRAAMPSYLVALGPMFRSKAGTSLCQVLALIGVLLLCPVRGLMAQQPALIHYTTANGLPTSEIYQSYNDSAGFMWFATDRGLVRYDGYEFRTYNEQDGLCTDVIFGFYKDRHNRIWVNGYGGCFVYLEDGQIKTPDWNVNHVEHGLVVGSMYLDSRDTFWMGSKSSNGYYKIDPEGNTTYQGNLYAGVFTVLEVESGGYIGYRSRGHVESNKSTFLSGEDTSSFNTPGDIHLMEWSFSILSDSANDEVFFSRSRGITRLVNGKQDSEAVVRGRTTMSLFKDRNNGLWVGMLDKGVAHFPEGDLKAPPEYFLENKSVTSITQDHEGGFWFTTLHDGLYHMPSFETESYQLENGLTPNFVAINASDSLVLVGTSSGEVYSLDTSKGMSLEFQLSGQINGIFHHRGLFWVEHDANTGIPETQIRGYEIHDVIGKGVSYLPFSESYCMGFSLGAYHITKDGKADRAFSNIQARVTTLSAGHAKLWVGTHSGIWTYDGATFEPWFTDFEALKVRITDIIEMDSRLVVSTRSNGIFVIEDDTVYNLDLSSGLPTMDIDRMSFQPPKTIWAGSKQGVVRIEFTQGESNPEIRVVDRKSGLVSNEINDLAVQNDHIWVATPEGVARFHSDLIRSEVQIPLYITSVIVNDTNQVTIRDAQVFNSDARSFDFQFVGLSYKTGQQLEYEYKLDGFDSQWHRTTHRSVKYMLSPGDYAFKVRLPEGAGPKPTLASMAFTITPPYYLTWWFIASTLLLFLTGVAQFARWRLQAVRRQNELELRIVKSKHQTLSAQLKPHFVFNALNSVQSYVLLNKPEESGNYMTKLASLLRQILNHSTVNFISLQEELRLVETYLEIEKLRFKERLSYKIILDPDLDTDTIEVPTQLVQPYVENAIWHGIMPLEENGLVTIKVAKESEVLTITIEDNGVGRAFYQSKKKERKSMGMRINQERLKLINTLSKETVRMEIIDIKNENGAPSGTRVVLSIPIELNQNLINHD